MELLLFIKPLGRKTRPSRGRFVHYLEPNFRDPAGCCAERAIEFPDAIRTNTALPVETSRYTTLRARTLRRILFSLQNMG
jgi:hypothetical protein